MLQFRSKRNCKICAIGHDGLVPAGYILQLVRALAIQLSWHLPVPAGQEWLDLVQRLQLPRSGWQVYLSNVLPGCKRTSELMMYACQCAEQPGILGKDFYSVNARLLLRSMTDCSSLLSAALRAWLKALIASLCYMKGYESAPNITVRALGPCPLNPAFL